MLSGGGSDGGANDGGGIEFIELIAGLCGIVNGENWSIFLVLFRSCWTIISLSLFYKSLD